MAQDLGYDFAAGPLVTLLSADLATGAQSAFTAVVDFSNPGPLMFGFDITLTTLTGATGYCFLEAAWSHDGTNFADVDNVETIAGIKCTASADKRKVGAFPLQSQYAKFRLNNQSGGTIDGTASNTALLLFDIYGNQV